MPDQWITGSGYEISFDDLVKIICSHADSGGKIFIGSDSMLRHDTCVFATAICLHGEKTDYSGRYFCKKKRYGNTPFSNLQVRISAEVQKSIDIAMRVVEIKPDADVEIHIDIGASAISKTRTLVSMLTKWTRGAGFPCKIKPDAWASASIADRHTK